MIFTEYRSRQSNAIHHAYGFPDGAEYLDPKYWPANFRIINRSKILPSPIYIPSSTLWIPVINLIALDSIDGTNQGWWTNPGPGYSSSPPLFFSLPPLFYFFLSSSFFQFHLLENFGLKRSIAVQNWSFKTKVRLAANRISKYSQFCTRIGGF